MANMGTGNGVRADIAFDSLSKELKDLIETIESNIEIETEDVETIKEKLRKIAQDVASKRSTNQKNSLSE
jgi:uncharacterized protein YoxC